MKICVNLCGARDGKSAFWAFLRRSIDIRRNCDYNKKRQKIFAEGDERDEGNFRRKI